MVDADHFKRINDEYGHLVGDQVIKFIGENLGEGLRAYDSLGRYGGEEFILILPGTVLEEAANIAERMRAVVSNSLVSTDAGKLTFSVSIGVSCLSEEDQSIEDVIDRADKGLIKSKATGRNRVEVVCAKTSDVVAS